MMYEVKRQQLPNGEVMAYREENTAVDAPVLLLIHGNQSSSLYYEHLMQQFRKEAHIYAIDMMGFGDSSYKNPHTCMKDWADDVAQFMDAQKIRKAVALGWSAGGGTALELAACYPEKVQHLVLLASVGVQGFRLPRRNADLTPMPGEYLVKLEDVVKDPVTMIPITGAIERKDTAFLHMVWAKTIFNRYPPAESDFDAYMNAILKERCFVDISVALCQFNITKERALVEGTGRISQIQCPVTWIHGREDMIVPYVVGEESIRFFESSAQLIPIEDAGHASFMDQPEVFRTILINILKSIG